MEYKEQNMYTYHIKEMMYLTTNRKTLMKFGIYTSLFVVAVLITLLPNIINKKNHLSPHQMRFPSDLKYILFWNPLRGNKKKLYERRHPEFPSGQTAFIEQKCPHINCYITYNKNILKKDESNFDAVVINAQDISKMSISELNLTRSPYQKYIFRSHESAENHPVCNHKFDHFFNLTWTYKLNSDIPHPFINIYDENNKLVGPKKKVQWITKMNYTDNRKKISKKNKAVACIITNCETKNKNEDFIGELRSELKGYNYTVDIYGPCGDKQCPGRGLLSCHKMVEKKYFFQLALEESLAEDYVTDGIVKLMMQFTIPITLGNSNYTRFLPPGSYINVRTFNMKKLGALIDYLIKNPKMYEFFFDWKNHYFYTVRSKSYVCDLCTKLNSNHTKHKVYKHFRHWWNPDYKDICNRMRLFNMFNS